MLKLSNAVRRNAGTSVVASTWRRSGIAGAMTAVAALSGCGGSDGGGGGGEGSPSTSSIDLTGFVPDGGTITRAIDASAAFMNLSGGGALTYRATVGDDEAALDSIGLMIDAETGAITGDFNGMEGAVITVTALGDADAVRGTARVTIQLSEPPTVSDTPLRDRTVTAGTPIAPIGTASAFGDPDEGDALRYEATVGNDGAALSTVGLEIDAETGEITGEITGAEDVTITVTATDGSGQTVTDSFVVTVVAQGVAPPPRTEVIGEEIDPIDLNGLFPASGGETPTLVVTFGRNDSGLEFDDSTNRITGTLAGTGDVRVTVTDGGTSQVAFVISAIEAVAANPPMVTDQAPSDPMVLTTGAALASPINVSSWFVDPDGNETLTFTASGLDGTGLMFESGEISGTFTGTSNASVTVRASDGLASAEHALEITANAAPTTTEDAPGEALVLTTGGGDLNLPIDAAAWFADSDMDQMLTYSLTDGSDLGLTIDRSTGAVGGAFTGTDEATIRVEVSDGYASVGHTVNITPNAAPTTTDDAPDDAVVLTVGGMDPNLPINAEQWFSESDDDQTLTYSLLDADGLGLTIDAESGEIGGRFTGTANTTIRVRASDGNGFADQALEITANNAPVVTSMAPGQAMVLTTGAALASPITAGQWFDEPDQGQTLTYSLTDGTDLGLTIDATSGEINGSFTGTDDTAITVRASDGNGFVEHTLDITANSAPTKSTDAPNEAMILTTGVVLTSPINAGEWFDDEDQDQTLMYSLTAGTDLGLTINADSGVIGGTFSGISDTSITVRTSDGHASVDHTLNITANAAPVAGEALRDMYIGTGTVMPMIDLSGAFTDPDGDTLTFSAMVGNQSLADANIGLTMTSEGVISGTFTGTANVEVEISAADGRGGTLGRSLTIIHSDFSMDVTGGNGDDLLIDDVISGSVYGGAGNDVIYHLNPGSFSRIYGHTSNDLGPSTDIDVLIHPHSIQMRTNTLLPVSVDSSFIDVGGNSVVALVLGSDVLIGIEEIRFIDQTLRSTNTGTSGNDILIDQTDDGVSFVGLAGDDIIIGNSGNDTISGGPGRDKILGNGGMDMLSGGSGDDAITAGAGADTLSGDTGNDWLNGGDDEDTATYDGNVRDFRFKSAGILFITDANTADGTDEGEDRLFQIEKLRFGDGTEIETANIDFGSGNSGNLNAHSTEASILYGEDGGYTFNGGTGADIFQFLTEMDSTSSAQTTIMGFDQSDGDRIALGREIGTVTVTNDGTDTTMSNGSGFSLIIRGVHDMVVNTHYYFIGTAPSSAVRGRGRDEIVAQAVDEPESDLIGLSSNEGNPAISAFPVDGDDAGVVSEHPRDDRESAFVPVHAEGRPDLDAAHSAPGEGGGDLFSSMF